MITVVFEFFNGIIGVDTLIEELNGLIGFNMSDKTIIDETIKQIKEYNQIDEPKEKYLNVCELLLHNAIYERQMQDVDAKELMLLITDYLVVFFIPKVSQKKFDELANEAILYDDIERVYRLANAYSDSKIDISKLENYIIENKNIFYIGQIMTFYLEDEYNLNRIVDKMLSLNDRPFLNKIKKDAAIKGYLPNSIFKRLTVKK